MGILVNFRNSRGYTAINSTTEPLYVYISNPRSLSFPAKTSCAVYLQQLSGRREREREQKIEMDAAPDAPSSLPIPTAENDLQVHFVSV